MRSSRRWLTYGIGAVSLSCRFLECRCSERVSRHIVNRRRRILFISPVPTHPPTAGNRVRVGALISPLRGFGHDVHFLHVRQEPGDDDAMRSAWGDSYTSAAYTPPRHRMASLKRRTLGRLSADARHTFGIDEWYDCALDAVLRDYVKRATFDTVIVSLVFYSKALECFGPDVLKIIDT